MEDFNPKPNKVEMEYEGRSSYSKINTLQESIWASLVSDTNNKMFFDRKENFYEFGIRHNMLYCQDAQLEKTKILNSGISGVL